MEFEEMEVRFDEYCDKCMYRMTPEVMYPCTECLETYQNETGRPELWKEEK